MRLAEHGLAVCMRRGDRQLAAASVPGSDAVAAPSCAHAMRSPKREHSEAPTRLPQLRGPTAPTTRP
eukprot:1882747-Pyramimonas_sp.AAC.1